MMEYKKETDAWIGTPAEHLKKLLETHACLCKEAKKLIRIIIDDYELKEKQNGNNN